MSRWSRLAGVLIALWTALGFLLVLDVHLIPAIGVLRVGPHDALEVICLASTWVEEAPGAPPVEGGERLVMIGMPTAAESCTTIGCLYLVAFGPLAGRWAWRAMRARRRLQVGRAAGSAASAPDRSGR